MIQLDPREATPQLAALLDLSRPTMPRALSVLEGAVSGQIFAADPARPAWVAVREAAYGTLYLGGRVDAALLAELLGQARQLGGAGLSLWPDDPLGAILPPGPAYDGRALFFPRRSPAVDLRPLAGRLPPGYSLAVRDARLFAQSLDYQPTLESFGSLEGVLRHTRGVVVLQGAALVCEAATGAPARGRIEVGVATGEAHRGRGLATAACAALIMACEAAGLTPWWDCAAHNLASARLARRLGFVGARAYRYLWWPAR